MIVFESIDEFTFQYGSNQIKSISCLLIYFTKFTFQYGSNQIKEQLKISDTDFRFTFQYGSNQIRNLLEDRIEKLNIYIPIWF